MPEYLDKGPKFDPVLYRRYLWRNDERPLLLCELTTGPNRLMFRRRCTYREAPNPLTLRVAPRLHSPFLLLRSRTLGLMICGPHSPLHARYLLTAD